MTATATVTWPTAEELRSVERLLADAANAVDLLAMRLNGLVNVEVAPSQREGTQAPSFSDLGTWTVFCGHADLELVALRDAIEGFGKVRDAMARDLSIEGGDDV